MIFSTPSMLVFCELASQKHNVVQEGRSITFSQNMGAVQGVPT